MAAAAGEAADEDAPPQVVLVNGEVRKRWLSLSLALGPSALSLSRARSLPLTHTHALALCHTHTRVSFWARV